MATMLIRKISPYLEADVLLGVFCSSQEAEQQRSKYVAMRTQSPATDPWREQPYKPDGFRASDVVAFDIQGSEISTGAAVFVISSYSEGFGQVYRNFISVHTDKAVAKRQAALLQEADTDSFPNYYRIQEAVAGQLLSDDRDLQPVWYEQDVG